MINALTFDIEESFQAEVFARVISVSDWPRLGSRAVDSTLRLLDLLARHQARATFFVVGWLAARHGSLVQEIDRRGHEVACHSHAHRMISGLDPDLFRIDLQRAKRVLEDAIGRAVVGYRAPTFSILRTTLWALDILAEEGFQYDSSIFPIRHDRYGMPEAPRFPHRLALPGGGELSEFPMSTVQVAGQRVPFCGGGYFRLAPYWLLRTGIRHVNQVDHQPAIVYLHAWELDPDQPRLPVSGLRRFRHYVNLHSTARKLERLLDEFAFASASSVLRQHGLMPVAA